MAKRKGRARGRKQRGSVLPVVLALTIGVGALTTGYVMRNVREHGREGFDRDSSLSLYDAWSQMEVVTRMVTASNYDGGGRNLALTSALGRVDGQFIDMDGWPTGVIATEEGGAGSGFYNIVSTATVGESTTRVSALCRERQSFADYNYFVNSHSLGISGGQSASFPYADAPEGSIHSNDRLVFYFPDRHFRDPVSAVNGFDFTAGAAGPLDGSGQNTWFHGPSNDHTNAILGLTDVDLPAFTTRADNILSLTGDFDFAKAKLEGSQARIEHWQRAHSELRDVLQWQEAFHYETRTYSAPDWALRPMSVPVSTPIYEDYQVPVYRTDFHHDLVTPAWTEHIDQPVYEQQLVTAAWAETLTGTRVVYDTIVDTPAWDETLTGTRQVQRQVWISGGGGGDTGGAGGTGDVGYWETQTVTETYTYIVPHPAVTHQQARTETYTYVVNHPAVYQQVQTGTRNVTIVHPPVFNDWSENVLIGTQTKQRIIGSTITWVTQNVWQVVGYHDVPYQLRVSDGWTQVPVPQWVVVPQHKVQDYTLSAIGTVYVKGDLYFSPMSKSAGDPYDTHVLDGSITFVTDESAYIQDSIVYGKVDANGVLQTAYLNGADRTKPYAPNTDYKGTSILGIVADQDVIYTSDLPSQAELNSTLLTKNGEVRVEGVQVATDGTVSQTNGGWVKMSLRRLGGMTTNQRPVSAYVDSNNAVTRGFVYGKSVYDVRQRTTPPRGFPTLNRPRVLATMMREVK